MPAPTTVGDNVLRVFTQRARIQVRKVANKGQIGVGPPEKLSGFVRIRGLAGRIMKKLVDDRPPQCDLAARTDKLLN